MSFFDDLFKTSIDYSDGASTSKATPGWPGWPGSSSTANSGACLAPLHQEFAASSPALSTDTHKAASASISIPVPPNAKSYRVILGTVQIDQGVPASTATARGRARSEESTAIVAVPDPLAAFGAVPLGMLEPSSGDIGTTEIQLTGGIVVPITVPQKTLRVTVVWGLVQATNLSAGALKVPVFVDFT